MNLIRRPSLRRSLRRVGPIRVRKSSAVNSVRLTGWRPVAEFLAVIAGIVIVGYLNSGTAHAAEVTPPVAALCSSDSDCEARGFDGYYGDPCDAACEAGTEPTIAPAVDLTAPPVVVDALADPTTFYVVPDVDNDPTAACLLSLDWTGHAGDRMEAIYAPTVVIAACKRAPIGTHPLSTDDVTPAVWRELAAIYGVDRADPTDPIVFSVPGVAHALSVIDDGIGR